MEPEGLDEWRQSFYERVQVWSGKLAIAPMRVRIQVMRRKWASCSKSGTVTFATDLHQEPIAFQEYVIVHELLHLKIRNHGRVFRALLQAHLPEYRVHEMLDGRSTCRIS